MRNASGSSSDRVNVLKRGSVRGVQSLLSSSPYGAGLDGRISPTPSVATSIGEVRVLMSPANHRGLICSISVRWVSRPTSLTV